MSEQYRCLDCGQVSDIEELIIKCPLCGCATFEHLRWTKCGNGSHWEGCADVHWDCRIAQLEAELARRDEQISTLVETVARLKEALPTFKRGHYYCDDCWYSCPKAEDGCCDERAGKDCNCGADEWNARIDLLMKELE